MVFQDELDTDYHDTDHIDTDQPDNGKDQEQRGRPVLGEGLFL